MSTLGSLMSLLGESQIRPWAQGMREVADTQRAETLGQTNLLELAELKRKQAAEQEFMTAVQNDPELRQRLFGGGGGPVLGSLQTAPGGVGAAPMTQQTTIPGQPPGAPQMVPGGQDLSQFATQGAPQSTLASLGPQPQGQMQAPRNPVLEMAQRDPRVALLMQQQMEAREAQQFKMQEQRLKMGTAAVEHVGQLAQGVTDQASLDAMRADLVSSGLGKYAAQLPQFYAKGAMEPFIAKALAVKDSLSLQAEGLKAHAEAARVRLAEQQAAAGVPKYTEDSTLNVAIDRRMQQAGIPRGTPPPEPILTQAQKDVEEGKVRVSASQGTGQVFDTPEGKKRLRPGTNVVEPLYNERGEPLQPKPTQAEQETATFSNLARQGHTGAVELEQKGFTPGFWAKSADKLPLHIGNYLTSDEHQKYKDYVMDFAQAWLRRTSKGAITETEWKFVDERYFPQPGNSKKQIEQKRQARENVIKELEAEGKGTGRTGTQAQPTNQGTATTAWLTQMAKKYNISLDEAKKKAAAAGVQVE